MNFSRYIALILFSMMLLFSSGCVKQPTVRENVVDDRPAITFKSQSGALRPGDEVYLDGLPVGDAWRYQSNRAALRILSGSHSIEVKRNGETIFEESIYVGDGAVKEILIP